MRKYGIKVSAVVKRALEEEVEKRKVEELRKMAGELGELFSRMSEEEIVKSIRESRRSR